MLNKTREIRVGQLVNYAALTQSPEILALTAFSAIQPPSHLEDQSWCFASKLTRNETPNRRDRQTEAFAKKTMLNSNNNTPPRIPYNQP